ncbi:hypothetical protein Fcan01_16092 [Folsomia candida]|uniref:DUF4806 domain-containing protein n=1 Tax=Folsomia candida TaxID=158441 RepID=A0A226DUZ0_FOLCA|nr:hypothetical protein Fcan01_16092 [Folsomia candida]
MSSKKLKNYSVVNFYQENKVAIVCSSWLDNTKTSCSWPIGPNSEDHLKKNHPPTTSWPKYSCNFMQEFNSLASAKVGLIQAKKSDQALSSGVDEISTRKIHKGKKKNPSLKKPAQRNQEESSTDESSLSSCSEESDKQTRIPFVPICAITDLGTGESSSNSVAAETIQSETENIVLASVNNSNSLNDSTIGAIPNISLVDVPGFETISELVTLVHELKAESQNLQTVLVRELVKINENLVELLRRTSSPGEPTLAEQLRHPPLPSTSLENFQGLIDWINEDELHLNSLVMSKINLGGRNLEEITNRILSELISTELAKICSHSGKGKKSEVGLQSRILELIYKSVRLNKDTKYTTNSEIDVKIRAWIKNKKDPRKVGKQSCQAAAYSGQGNDNE